jgi:Ca2+-binding RTX toxin-like protein
LESLRNPRPRKSARAHSRIIATLIALFAFAILSNNAAADTVVSVDGNNALSVAGGAEGSTITTGIFSGQYVVTRSDGNLVSGGSPCFLLASNKVSCSFGISTPSAINIALGDGPDQATIDSTIPTHVTASIKGVGRAISNSAPLDATIDETGSFGSATGGPMPDTINVQSPNACAVSVNGGDGDDQISIAAHPSSCLPGGTNLVTGGNGDDMINAEASTINLKYLASSGHDIFMGGSGADHITVGSGPDWAFGGGGNDRFYDNGGPDPSKLWGGPGDDTFTDWDYNDLDITFFDGGSGFDQVAYHMIADGIDVSVSLDGIADDGVVGETDNFHQSVEGIGTDGTYNDSGQFRGNDTLTGSDGPNLINGRQGDDQIYGLGGNDELWGGPGADFYHCGDGYDIVHNDGYDTADEDCEEVL